jgi:histidinol dehydrogenase
MKVIKYPPRSEWANLLKRPVASDRELPGRVSAILEAVRRRGDAALFDYTRQLDRVDVESLAVAESEFAEADARVRPQLKEAIARALSNIERFHAAERIEGYRVETSPGVECWKKWLPIERVGLYVPAGSAPLFSTMMMLAVPARIAGCREIIACSPPGPDGRVDATTIYAARLCGVSRIFKVGGAQAIAAMAFGTETIPNVYKIFGPGNRYVTEAKLQVMREGVGIDMPAGPSEVAVLADETCMPEFVAADLLSQAEHGPDSQIVLVSTSERVIDDTFREIEKQVDVLPRRDTARKALDNSTAILIESVRCGLQLLNDYAPEHLIIATENAEMLAEQVTNAGSVFIGNHSCESAGDYASGTNHTLPTNGAARSFSGVSVSSFMKAITFQTLSAEGIRDLGPVIETLADAEGLAAHKNAVTIRREALGL